jgi:hypothetical protein
MAVWLSLIVGYCQEVDNLVNSDNLTIKNLIDG